MSDDQRPQAAQPPAATNNEPPLTDRELQELREIMEADRRVKWFWRTTRTIAIWLAAVGGSFMLLWDGLVKAVKHLAGS